jgi:Xaa-Pro aminopeptidase
MPTTPSIAVKEYAARRARLLTLLKNEVAVVHAGEAGDHLLGHWRPNPDFEYLTGIRDEAGAVLLLDPTAPNEAHRAVLFLRPLDPELERWDGHRETISSTLRGNYGFQLIHRLPRLGMMLGPAAKRAKRLACLHQFAEFNQPISADLALFQQLAERIPNLAISDRTAVLPKMRSVKSKSEQAMVRHACDITAIGFADVLRTMRAGMNEFEVQEALEHAYRAKGSRGPAYNTIVGGGFNATVLHYGANDQKLKKGDLVVIDSGADFGGYAADVTRTLPVGGTFTKRAKEIYSIVLKSLDAATKAAKPGCTFAQLDKAARTIITDAGHGDRFIHGIGHHLGLEVHDASPPGPLKVGAIITIEPGIYLPEENLGVRIEDDILITAKGPVILTKKIPKSVAAIERAMARSKKP